MEAIEYRTLGRDGWGSGPWDGEPDKVQWIDEATGLDCLAVRGPVGAWCGYVGVPEGHRYFGIDNDGCSNRLVHECSFECPDRIGAAVRVHGGLTFSNFCAGDGRERFEEWRAGMIRCREKVAAFPMGDSAQAWHESGQYVDDYEGWCKWMEATSICHVAQPGRPDRVWWFGFDCAHSGDDYPSRRRYGALVGFARNTADVYRTLDYVKSEAAHLAEQLARVA